MTGLRACQRGSSFFRASPMAGTRIEVSARLVWRRRYVGVAVDTTMCSVSPYLNSCPACSCRCSRIGPSASAGKKVSAPTIRTTPISNPVKSGVPVGKVPALAGTIFFLTIDPARARDGENENEATKPHRGRQGGVVVEGVAREARERAAVVAGRRGERVKD